MITPSEHTELQELFRGREIYLRDRRSESMAPTSWLRSVATLGADDYGRRVAAIHPDDRGRYFDGFLLATHEPGSLVPVDYRITASKGWTTERATFVSLLDDDDVRATVVAVAATGTTPTVIGATTGSFDGEYDTAPWAIFSIDASTTTVTAEGDVEALTGRTAEQLVGGYLIECVHPDSFDEVLTMMVSLLADPGGTRHFRDRLVHPDGTSVWVEATLLNRLQPDGSGDILGVVVDIRDRKAKEDELDERNQEFRLLAEKMALAVFRADAHGVVTFRNRRWNDLVEGAAQATRVADLVHADARVETQRRLRDLMAEQATSDWSLEFVGLDGQTLLHVEWSATGDTRSRDRSFVGWITDVTATAQLKIRAETDSLTGLLNRRSLEEHLREAVERDPEGSMLVFIDLDGFKTVNDSYGHAVGDIVLRTVAERLRATMRPTDIIGRYGGDEFVIVCHHATPDPEQLAETVIVGRIAAALRPEIEWDGGSWQPAASVGTARPERDERPDHVLERADAAMFAVKRERTTARR